MKKLTALLLSLALALSLTACGAPASSGTPASQPAQSEPQPTPDQPDAPTLPTTDRSGAAVTIPETVESIVTLAPSLSQTVTDLGLADKIVGYDLNSVGMEGLPADVPTFDTVTPDVEALLALAPDVLLVSSLSLYDQEAPYQPLIDAGICVLCVPTANSIDDIFADIAFLGEALGAGAEAETLAEGFQSELDRIANIAAAIPEEERVTVYFEISPAPWLYSFGSGVYMDEMLALIGAKNALTGEGWLSVEAESVVAAAPDVILTNVNFLDDPVGEILGRDGWAGVPAIADGRVYAIDNMASSLPNEGITAALWEMLSAVYPNYYHNGSQADVAA